MSQQIYIPLGGKYPIPYEFEADTMPVPRGHTSVLWEFRDGNITAAEAMVILFLNHGSTWASGQRGACQVPMYQRNWGLGCRVDTCERY